MSLFLGNHFWDLALLSNSSAALAQKIYTFHAARVAADGGVIESEAVCRAYIEMLLTNAGGISTEAQFKTRFPVTIDPAVFGYKVGTGALSTLGFAANKLYSINEAADQVQATAASQPLLLRHNDVDGNYVYFPRVASTINQVLGLGASIAFTPASQTLVITAKILLTNQTATTYDTIVFNGTQWVLQFRNVGANKLFRISGSTSAADSSQYTPSTTSPHWIRATLAPGGITYEWSANGTSWTTLNTGVALPTYGSASTVAIGASTNRTQNAGNIYYIRIENQTSGALVECDLNNYDPAVSQTQFTTGSSTWTIQYGTNTTGLKMALVDRSLVQGDGIAMKMSATLNFTQPHTVYALRRRHGIGPIYGMAAASSLSNDGTNTTLNNGTALNISNTSRNKQLITAESNGATSRLRIDNGSDTVGDAGANNGTYLDLFGNGASFGNFEIYSLLISNQADSNAFKTAVYNYLNG